MPLRLVLDLWKEACRHIDVGESVDRMAPLIQRRLPLRAVIVRRLDVARSRLDTVAIGVGSGAPLHLPSRSACEPELLEELLNWCRRNEVDLMPDSRRSGLAAALLPEGLSGPVLAGPLISAEGPAGVLLLALAPQRTLDADDLDVANALLEPFSVALENDRNFHELVRLREAREAENRALLSRLQREDISESVVGAEGGLREVMESLEKVAGTDAPVLLLGETGSGKEVIARAIHSHSHRARGPIVRVNCGAIPTELVDSELFGHERGSFTGAVGTRQGWFERADGGTLFLDEIGELPPAAQVRLLRILQDGTFERVGGERSITVDVRIVAATHRRLEEMVAEGRFRQDLWYRLNVFQIRIPPLRERPSDVPALAAHFAWRAGKRLGGNPLVPSPEDLDRLLSYSWPGNVRELASVIERAAILGDGRRLEIAAALGAPAAPREASAEDGSGSDRPHADERAARGAAAPAARVGALDDSLREAITRALRACHGRIEGPHGAAALLQINPHTLRSKMRRLGVAWKTFRA